MNRKYFTTFILFFSFYFSTIEGQIKSPVRPFEKIKFEGLDPIWHTTFYDTTYNEGIGDGYNRLLVISSEVKPIIQGNHLYLCLHHVGVEEVIGTFIKKVDLATGNELWSDYFGLPKDTNQEIGRLMYINSDGNVELVCQLKTDPYGFAYSLYNNKNMLFTKRIYNQENGSLLEWYRPDNNDTLHLRSVYSMFQYSGELLKKDDELVYIQRVSNGNPLQDYSITESKNAVFTKDLTRSFLKTEDAIFVPKIIPDGNDAYLIPEMNVGRNTLRLKFVDSQFKETNVQTVEDESLHILQLISYKPEEEKLLFFHFLKDDIPFDDLTPCEIRIYDYRANLLKKVAIPLEYGANFWVLDWDDDDNVIVAATTFMINESVVEKNELHILKATGSEISLLKSFASKDSLRYLNLNNALNTYSIKIDDTKILLSAVERSMSTTQFNSVVNDVSAVAQSIFLLDISNLGIVSTKNTAKDDMFFTLVPNPVMDIVHIMMKDNSFKGKISIMDHLGRMVKDTDVDHESQISIPLDNLANGIYYVKVTGLGSVYFPVQKFIKI